MNKILYPLLALIVISVSSCEKILEKQPLDFYPSLTQYYNTPEQLEANIRGVYNTLKLYSLYGTLMHYRLGLEADEGFYTRESPTSGPQTYNFTSGHSDVNSYWRDLYIGINRANNFITNVDFNPDIDVDFRNRLRGEALFLRGYFYFMLVKAYGGVPLILHPLDDVEDIDIPRASVEEVYAQVLFDMKEAEKLVDGIEHIGHGGRINKSAVRGILARVCLHMAGYPLRDVTKYQEAKNWASKVINDPQFKHQLNPSFSQIFINYAQDIYDPKESIWEVEFMGNGLDAYSETGQVGYLAGPRTSSSTVGAAFGGVKGTSKLYDIYKIGDLRRDWTLASFIYVEGDHNFTDYRLATTGTNGVRYRNNRDAAKFRREYEILLPKHLTRTPQNFPLLRYADVLLMFAEADYEITHQGIEGSNGMPSDSAVNLLMEVRMRSFNMGGVRTVAMNTGGTGSGYNSPPNVTLEDVAAGSGASFTAVLNASGGIARIDIDRDPITGYKMGSGYVGITNPNSAYVTITPTSGGTGGRFTAHFYNAVHVELTAGELADFRKTIQDERMRELAFETLRKDDLVRWGIFEFEMRQVRNILSNANLTDLFFYNFYNNVREKHRLWPIPAREMNLNKALVQNPGW